MSPQEKRDLIERNLQYNYGVDMSDAPSETHSKQELIGHAYALRAALQTAKHDVITLLDENERVTELNKFAGQRRLEAIQQNNGAGG